MIVCAIKLSPPSKALASKCWSATSGATVAPSVGSITGRQATTDDRIQDEMMKIMRRSQLSYLALATSVLVCSGPSAKAREQPVYCYPPAITIVAHGQLFNGKLCKGQWGCACARWFCPQCSTPQSSTSDTGPLACEWTTCAPRPRPTTQRGIR
jgi:hypothetical protein